MKKIKAIFKNTLSVMLMAFLAAYLTVSFLKCNLNYLQWDEHNRLMALNMFFISCIIIWIIDCAVGLVNFLKSQNEEECDIVLRNKLNDLGLLGESFTSQQLAKKLPFSYMSSPTYQNWENPDIYSREYTGFVIYNREPGKASKTFFDKKEANVRAMMLIYLLENNLIKS